MKHCIKLGLLFCSIHAMQVLQAQSQKIIGTLKAAKNNAITITPYSVDSTLLQQTTAVQQKALEDLFPPINTTIPTNNTLKGKKMETGSIVAEKKKPILFQPFDPSTEVATSTDSVPSSTVTQSFNQLPINNQTPITNVAANNANNTLANMYNTPQQAISAPLANTAATTAASSVATNTNNATANQLYQIPATNSTNTSITNYMVYVNSNGYSIVCSNNNSTCTVSSFGRVINYNTGNGSNAGYNMKGQLETIGTIKLDYTYEGRLAAINSIPIQYNFNGNIQQIGGLSIIYTNGKIESIGNSKLYYDASGNITGADATSNVVFIK